MEKIDAKVVETGVTAVIEQIRAEKKEFWEEAVRLAEEAGRLKALLQDAQRDVERYRYLRRQPVEGGPYGRPRIAIPTSATSGDFVNEEDADVSIDAAMAAEREGRG